MTGWRREPVAARCDRRGGGTVERGNTGKRCGRTLEGAGVLHLRGIDQGLTVQGVSAVAVVSTGFGEDGADDGFGGRESKLVEGFRSGRLGTQCDAVGRRRSSPDCRERRGRCGGWREHGMTLCSIRAWGEWRGGRVGQGAA